MNTLFLIGKVFGITLFFFGIFIFAIYDRFWNNLKTRKTLERIFLILCAITFGCGLGILVISIFK
jgi:threonine/homoserine/homoserine lactone efflux protein